MKVKPEDIVNGTDIAKQLVVTLLRNGVDNGEDTVTYEMKNGYYDLARLIVDLYVF